MTCDSFKVGFNTSLHFIEAIELIADGGYINTKICGL
jgi:hypothetical protein